MPEKGNGASELNQTPVGNLYGPEKPPRMAGRSSSSGNPEAHDRAVRETRVGYAVLEPVFKLSIILLVWKLIAQFLVSIHK